MAYSPYVTYWVKQKKIKKKKPVQCICFRDIKDRPSIYSPFTLNKIEKLYFKCKLPPEKFHLNLDSQVFYVNFLEQLLRLFKIKIKSKLVEKSTHRLFFVDLKNLNKSSVKTLLVLTALRYLQEFPEIVNDFYKSADPKDKLSDLFIKFQESHRNTNSVFYDNRMGHALIWNNANANISLEEFKKRFNNEKSRISVQNYFSPDKTIPGF